MSVRFNVVLSDELVREIESTVAHTESSKSEIFRKALQLYFAARQGKAKGMKVGLVNPDSGKLETEIIGL